VEEGAGVSVGTRGAGALVVAGALIVAGQAAGLAIAVTARCASHPEGPGTGAGARATDEPRGPGIVLGAGARATADPPRDPAAVGAQTTDPEGDTGTEARTTTTGPRESPAASAAVHQAARARKTDPREGRARAPIPLSRENPDAREAHLHRAKTSSGAFANDSFSKRMPSFGSIPQLRSLNT